MTNHPTMLEGYHGPLVALAVELGNLRYDALASFLRALEQKLTADSAVDAGRGRPALASALQTSAASVATAATAIEKAWRIARPHMPEENTTRRAKKGRSPQ